MHQHVLDRAYLRELEKLASTAKYAVELHPKPRDLGIYAKKTGKDDRGTAYSHGVAGTAAAGASGGAASWALTGGSPVKAALTAKGRRGAVEGIARDASALGQAASKAKSDFYTGALRHLGEDAKSVTSVEEAKKLLARHKSGASGAGAAVAGAERAVGGFMKSEAPTILRRRAIAGGKGALVGIGLAGAARVASNAATYEGAKALASKE